MIRIEVKIRGVLISIFLGFVDNIIILITIGVRANAATEKFKELYLQNINHFFKNFFLYTNHQIVSLHFFIKLTENKNC